MCVLFAFLEQPDGYTQYNYAGEYAAGVDAYILDAAVSSRGEDLDGFVDSGNADAAQHRQAVTEHGFSRKHPPEPCEKYTQHGKFGKVGNFAQDVHS